jgi:hypothetical protein
VRPRLLLRDRDFELGDAPAWNGPALLQDLGLEIVVDAMAAGDPFLAGVARNALLQPLVDPPSIVARQAVVTDALRQPDLMRGLYEAVVATIASERRVYWGVNPGNPAYVLRRSLDVMNGFLTGLAQLRRLAERHADDVSSDGFRSFFGLLRRELDDPYLAEARERLRALRFRHGMRIALRLGPGHRGAEPVLLAPPGPKRLSWRTLVTPAPPRLSYRLQPRDETGVRALQEIEARGIDDVAHVLARSCDHVLDFLTQARAELGFLVGCVRLRERLGALSLPTCFPTVLGPGAGVHAATGLYDAALALASDEAVVGNDVAADDRDLVVITGANQGGKTTFLRSVGQAQVLMQAGMFVPAAAFGGAVASGVVTHFRREEDAAMRSGKLDEELERMSRIVDRLAPGALLLLLNESFAATHEREGSEIARQVVEALTEARMRVWFVTHLVEFATGVAERGAPRTLFLRADPRPDGTRSYRLHTGAPLPTSHGRDVYERVFTASP